MPPARRVRAKRVPADWYSVYLGRIAEIGARVGTLRNGTATNSEMPV